jgi:ABC-type oligopeptide transport system substrate-binding subunit
MLKGAGMSIAGAILSACGGTATPNTPNQASTGATAASGGAASSGATTAAGASSITNALGVALPGDALPLDQQYILLPVGQTGGGYGHIMESLYNRAFEHAGGYETLTTLNTNLEVVGVGAESWKVSEDGLQWDFALRKDLTFSDGTPITAEDWVYTLRRSLSNGYDFAWFYYDIKNAAKVTSKELPPEQLGIEAVDTHTLRVTTEAPTPYFPAIGVWFGVAPKQAYEKNGDNWALDPAKYISSGPFILKEFERGVRHKWELNPSYKGVRKPYVTEIREQLLPQGPAGTPTGSLPSYIAKETQQYIIDGNTPAGEAGLIEQNPILKSESHPQPPGSTDYLGFNTLPGKFAPLDNPDVRMALSKAIDKETLVKEIFRGFAEPAWGILPKGFPNNNDEALKKLDPNVYDPEAAKQLLSKAGYAGGAGFPTFELWLRQPNTAQQAMAQAIQARWKENLGITVELKPADFQSFTDTSFAQKNAPMYFVSYSLDYYDPATFLNVFRNGGRHPHENPEWTEFYNKANATLQPEERLTLLKQAEQQLVESTAWYFLQSPFSIYLWPCNLAGETVQPNKDGYQFNTGGGVGSPHAYEGLYWSNSTCRADLR